MSPQEFDWQTKLAEKDSYIESWEKRYSELMKYKIVNGNCRVPKTSTEFPQLGHWVKQMRKYRAWKEEGKPYPSTFTQARIDRLVRSSVVFFLLICCSILLSTRV